MTTRIESGGPGSGVAPTPTAARVTSPPARPFQNVLRAGSQALLQGAEAATSKLPGGPVLAAAFRSNRPIATSAQMPEGSAGTMPDSASASSPEAMLEQNADRNMYYLQLQERISAESRAYTAMSNVLKARHDTIKNALSNIR